MKIVRNNIEIGKWYHGSTMIPQAYCNDKLVFPNIYSDVEEGYDVMCSGTINDYEGTAPEVYVMSVSKWYMRTTGGNYKEYGVYGADKNDPYVGELVVVDGHEWEYTSSGWVDLGEGGQTSDYEEYEELEFLTTTQGAYYYDTDYNISGNISKIWCKYYVTKHSSDFVVFSTYFSGNGADVQYFGSINYLGGNWMNNNSDQFTNNWITYTGNTEVELTYDRTQKTITCNGTTRTFSSDHGNPSGKTLKIFNHPSGTSSKQVNQGDKFYGYKVWEGNTLVIDLVPALRKSDNAMGLYDKVRDMFFTNSAFSVQLNNKVSPSSTMYTKYEYIQGNGTSYILTDYKPNANTSLELDIEGRAVAGISDYEAHFFGSSHYDPNNGNLGSKRFKLIYYGSSALRYDYALNQFTTSSSAINSRGVIKMNSTGGYLNDTKVVSFTNSLDMSDNQCPIAVFDTAWYNIRNGDVDMVGTKFNGKRYRGKIYSLKCYEGETLALDLVPAIKDNVVGMYDTVNGVMYSSENSTPFTVGGEHEDVGGLVKEYDEKDAPDPIDSGYYTSPDEFLKNNDNYYKKDYVTEIYEGGCEVITTEYVQGDQLTPSYVQGQESDFIVYDGGRYYKNYIYVTPVSTPIATGDYVRGEYIGPADVLVSGLTNSSTAFDVKINGTNTPVTIGSSSGSYYEWRVYGDLSQTYNLYDFSNSNKVITAHFNPDLKVSKFGSAFESQGNLTECTLPSGITDLGGYTFYQCTKLTSITLPDGLTSIGSQCFDYTGLINVYIPASVTGIANEAFRSAGKIESIVVDPNNTVYDSRENCNAIIETSTNKMLKACKNSFIPDSVASLVYSFYSVNINEVTVPSSVTNLYDAFKETNAVIHMLSTTPPTVNYTPFDGGYGIIYVPVGSRETYIAATNWSRYASRIFEEGYDFSTKDITGTSTGGRANHAFIDGSGTITYFFNTGINSDGTVNFAGDYPSGANSIGNGFSGFISSNILTIKYKANANITKLCNDAFIGASNIREITLPDGITNMNANSIFYNVYTTVVHIQCTTPPTVGTGTFKNYNGVIYVPVGTREAYIAASNWSSYASRIFEEGYDFSTAPIRGTVSAPMNGSYTYRSDSTTYSQNYLNVGNGVIVGYPSHDVQTIGLGNSGQAFLSGNNCLTIDLSSLNTLTNVSSWAFYYAKGLNRVTLPASVTSMQSSFYTGTNNCILILLATTPPSLINYISSNITDIYVPDASVNDYKAASNWSRSASIIKPISELPNE